MPWSARRGGKSPRGRACHGGTELFSREAAGRRAEKSRYRSQAARTADRHRQIGRGSRGRRKKHCQGTRQNGPVTSGEGAPAQGGRNE